MISIVVPAYNEEEVIGDFINKWQDVLTSDDELIIVNDGSSDKTEEIVKDKMERFKFLKLINHEHNKGLGAALKTGFEAAQGQVIVTMDSDLTHPPKTARLIARQVISGDCDVCIASRYVNGGGMQDVPWWRVWISELANDFFRTTLEIEAKDVTAGFKAYKSDIIKNTKISKTGFSIQLEIMAQIAQNKNVKFKDVPFILVNRQKGVSKFNLGKMPGYFMDYAQIFFRRWTKSKPA